MDGRGNRRERGFGRKKQATREQKKKEESMRISAQPQSLIVCRPSSGFYHTLMVLTSAPCDYKHDAIAFFGLLVRQ
jgi:hypothetical protein